MVDTTDKKHLHFIIMNISLSVQELNNANYQRITV